MNIIQALEHNQQYYCHQLLENDLITQVKTEKLLRNGVSLHRAGHYCLQCIFF